MLGWLIILSLLALPQQQLPPRDTPNRPSVTGIVRGRVVAAATGAPLHRVRVALNGPVPNAPSAVTDARGEFEIVDVPPGTYTLTATRAGYLTIRYGQQRPRELGRPLEMRQGTVLENIDLAMPQGSVLAGRVTDETGDPAPGVRVEALEYRYLRGHRVLVPAKIATTNDIGEYRLSGLEPGSYRLRASSTDVWESDDGKSTYVFAMTYFPGVTGAGQPDAISLGVGQEVAGLDLQLVPGRAATVTGSVEDASGAPMPHQMVYLSNIIRTIDARVLATGQAAAPTRTNGRGAFQFSKLPPGEYLVHAGGEEENATERFTLGHADARHVRLTPRRPARVSGTITTDEGSAPPFAASRIRIQPVPTDPERVLPQPGESAGIPVRPDFTFRADRLEGPQLFRVTGLPSDWMLKSVRLGERDLTDVPLEIHRAGEDVTGLQLVLSRKGALISGEVVADPAAGTGDVTIVVFPENSGLWGPGSRYVHATRPDDKGQFSVPQLPPGTYRIVAASGVMEGQWEDPSFLQSHARDAVRVQLAEGMLEKVKLTAGGAR